MKQMSPSSDLIIKNTPEQRNLWVSKEARCSIMKAVRPFHCHLLQTKCPTKVCVQVVRHLLTLAVGFLSFTKLRLRQSNLLAL